MNWHKEIMLARSAGAVCELANEYLRSVPRPVHAALGLPGSIANSREIVELHRRLADAATSIDDEDLHEAAVVFMRAAARILELEDRHDGPVESEGPRNFRMLGRAEGA